ncbi:MAG: site-specific recombinase [Burkholderiaceae bacterium]|nr:site-specific recombinase [Burkholderiaceae bacterium]
MEWSAASSSVWDLTALLNAAAHAADPKAPLPDRNLWVIRALEWLRHAPLSGAGDAGGDAAADDDEAPRATPRPVLRLKHLLNVLDRHPEHRVQVATVLGRFWAEMDSAALFADFGFSSRANFFGEIGQRLKLKLLPLTPASTDPSELFGLLFPGEDDGLWLESLDEVTLARLLNLVPSPPVVERAWLTPLLDAIMYLASAVRAAGFSGALRRRMSPELLTEAPFRQLAVVAERIRELALVPSQDDAALLREAQYLRALLDSCRQCADSVHGHLEEHGVSINVVFDVDQLRQRTYRIEQLLNCVISREPAREVTRLLAELVTTAAERRSIRALFARHYSLLARKVAERSAETGDHYITRDSAAYRHMLGAAAGGGAVIAGTTFVKFFVLALGLSAFWGGFWAGMNYAVSFVIVHLLHWTVATKQPAMTAPALAEKLADVADDAAVDRFVDEVANLIRSQAAGIFGNLAAVIPLVLLVQWASQALFGTPLVHGHAAEHVLDSITLLGPTALFAAFTGVLLFASSLIAGWVENWFVWHRLDSAIAWNPRIVDRLGTARAQRWAIYWRTNISGFASNISLGLMLGIVPAVALFFGLPIEVRHVTLSTGQLAAAAAAQGLSVLQQGPFWWCVAGIVVTGLLNLTVSFFLAFRVAMRSRGIRLADRSRIRKAIFRRVRSHPVSFVLPPKPLD